MEKKGELAGIRGGKEGGLERIKAGKEERLAGIREKICSQLECPLKNSAKNLVFGKGNFDAKVFVVGEAPGKNEDETGIPFVGAAGKNLDGYLKLAGLTLDSVYIANILKYRPPENRDPSESEILSHTPYLVEQIRVVEPKILVPLGNFATKFVLGGFLVSGMKEVEGTSRLHGRKFEVEFEGRKILVFPIYHPAAAIYNRKLIGEILKDFEELGKII
ncbi:MAG: uracil-DNA glycosylase [Candidatus Micrarchaeota archaeon]